MCNTQSVIGTAHVVIPVEESNILKSLADELNTSVKYCLHH